MPPFVGFLAAAAVQIRHGIAGRKKTDAHIQSFTFCPEKCFRIASLRRSEARASEESQDANVTAENKLVKEAEARTSLVA